MMKSSRNFYLPIKDAKNTAVGTRINLIAKAIEIGVPRKCGGSDYFLTLKLVDETEPTPGFSVNIFEKNLEKLPVIRFPGDIISLHCVEVKMYGGDFYCTFKKRISSFALFDGKTGGELTPYQTSLTRRYMAANTDEKLVLQLRALSLCYQQEEAFKPLLMCNIEPDRELDIVCKVLDVCKTSTNDWIILAWDGTDTPPVPLQMDLDMEAKTPISPEISHLPRELLCALPKMGSMMEIIIDKVFEGICLLKGGGQWVKFYNIIFNIQSGGWRGLVQNSSKVRIIFVENYDVQHRQRSYKDLMIQCNILGRSETRTCKKLDKAIEKINKLKIRLQEVEKALEEKKNNVLRDLKGSSKLKPKQVNFSYIEQNVRYPTMEDQAVRHYATENSIHITLSSNDLDHFCRSEITEFQKISSPLAYEESNHAADLNMDSYNRIDVDNLNLISDSNGHPTIVVECENGQADQDAQPISGIRSYSMQKAEAYPYTKVSAGAAYCKFGDDSKDLDEGSPIVIKKKATHNMSMITTEKILMDGIQKEAPYLAAKEGQACVSSAYLGNPSFSGSLVPEGANRSTNRWCRQIQSISSSGDLIVVGADGRGGRIKVLKAREECSGASVTTVGSKRQKRGAKSQFNIEHFFEKTQAR